ncbi:MAG: glutaredoxin family protein [Calditrichia bacterium]
MFCGKLKEFLSAHHIKYTERDITSDEKALTELEDLGIMSTPVTQIGDEVIVGFNRARLEELLHVKH